MSVSEAQRVAPDAAELEALRGAVRDACERHAGPDEARRLVDTTPAGRPGPGLWRALVQDLGVGGLLVPERFGGADAGWPVVRVVLEELGRSLAAAPYVASAVLAPTLLLAAGDEPAAHDLLPAIAEGRVVATVAVVEPHTDWDDWAAAAAPERAATTAQEGPGGWLLSGRKRVVPFGATADLLLVLAAVNGRTALFAVEATAAGLRTEPHATLDGTRPVADVVFASTPARLIGAVGGVSGAVRRAIELGGLALAAEDVGAMRQCLQLSVDYALLRTQFDRVIGSFQAVKHKLADMLVRVELAEAAVEEACLLADGGTAAGAVAATVAHACAAEAFPLVAAETIQTHGGIGFTWEHPAHLYFRRAKASRLAFGGPSRYRERVLDRLQLDGPPPTGS